jgi:hypothetical protein
MPMRSLLNNPEHWSARVEETRAMAVGVSDPMARASLLRVAEEYDELVRRADQRLPNK